MNREPYTMTVAARLRRLLARRNMTQAELADAAGVSKQSVGQIVTGKVANPGIATVERLVEAMGATMAEYYRDEDN